MSKNDFTKTTIKQALLQGISLGLLSLAGVLGAWLVFLAEIPWLERILESIPLEYRNRVIIIETIIILILSSYLIHLLRRINRPAPFVASYHRPTFIERIEDDFKKMQEEIDRRKREGTDGPPM